MSAIHYSLKANMPLILVRIQDLKLHSFKRLQEVNKQPSHLLKQHSRVAEFTSLNYRYVNQEFLVLKNVYTIIYELAIIIILRRLSVLYIL